MNFQLIVNCLAMIVAFESSAKPFVTDFQQLLKSPATYHNKRVSLIGFAHVEGESFVLFKDAESAAKLLDSKAVFVAQRRNRATHDHLNKRWIRVTGVVDANSHGRWNFPCEILLGRAEAITRPSSGIENRGQGVVLPKFRTGR